MKTYDFSYNLDTPEYQKDINLEEIIVDISYDGNFIGTSTSSYTFYSSEYTPESAMAEVKSQAEYNGWIGDDGTYYPKSTLPDPGPDPKTNPIEEESTKLKDKVTSIQEAITKITNPATPPDLNLEKEFGTDDEILAAMIQEQSSNIPEERISDKDAEMIVSNYPKNHPSKTMIKEKKEEVLDASKQLGIKGAELLASSIQLNIELVASFITIGSSAAILPFGAGLPTAFSAVQGIFSSLQAYQTKVTQILPILTPLKDIPMLITNSGKKSTINNTVTAALKPVNVALGAVSGIISTLGSLSSSIPKIPGIGDEPPESIGGDIWGSKTKLTQEQIHSGDEHVWITVNATGGRWNYIYWWTSDNDPDMVSKNAKAITVKPRVSTKYSVLVRNKDSKDGDKWLSWYVEVEKNENVNTGISR